MQSNGDDMDDLFRRAAEEYPLNTGGANWEKMSALLKQQDEPQRRKGNKRQFLWLLLLLPVVFICNRLTDEGRPDSISSVGSNRTTGKETSTTAPVVNGKSNVQQPVIHKAIEPEPSDQTLPTPSASEKELPILRKFNETGKSHQDQRTTGTFQPLALRQTRSSQSTASPRTNKPDDGFEATKGEDHPVATISTDAGTSMTETVKNENEPATPVDSVSSLSEKPQATAEKKPGDKGHKPRFYVGAVAGPDQSTVRFERFSRVGFQAGVLLGYQVSHRVAVEVGALSSKKYYYSEGEYLNTEKLYLPANTKVLAVDGNCRMLELPVAVLYSFSKKPAHSWFASAGLSSYIMKKEDYDYDYLYVSSGNVVKHNKVYENATKDWLSIVQLSVGFTSKLGSVGHLRLEPYFSIPVKGIGYGSLPLNSYGLKIGILSKKF